MESIRSNAVKLSTTTLSQCDRVVGHPRGPFADNYDAAQVYANYRVLICSNIIAANTFFIQGKSPTERADFLNDEMTVLPHKNLTKKHMSGNSSAVQVLEIGQCKYIAIFSEALFFGGLKGLYTAGDLIFTRKSTYEYLDREYKDVLSAELGNGLSVYQNLIYSVLELDVDPKIIVSRKIISISKHGYTYNPVYKFESSTKKEKWVEVDVQKYSPMSEVIWSQLGQTLQGSHNVAAKIMRIEWYFISLAISGIGKAAISGAATTIAGHLAKDTTVKLIKFQAVDLTKTTGKRIAVSFIKSLPVVVAKSGIEAFKLFEGLGAKAELKCTQSKLKGEIAFTRSDFKSFESEVFLRVASVFVKSLIFNAFDEVINASIGADLPVSTTFKQQLRSEFEKHLTAHLISLFTKDLYEVFYDSILDASVKSSQNGWDRDVFDKEMRSILLIKWKGSLVSKMKNMLLGEKGSKLLDLV